MSEQIKIDPNGSIAKAVKAKPEDFKKEMKIENVQEQTVKTEQYDIFTLVKKDRKVFVAVGNNIVTHSTFDRVEQAKKYIDSKPWELILNTCAVMQSMLKQMEEQTNK